MQQVCHPCARLCELEVGQPRGLTRVVRHAPHACEGLVGRRHARCADPALLDGLLDDGLLALVRLDGDEAVELATAGGVLGGEFRGLPVVVGVRSDDQQGERALEVLAAVPAAVRHVERTLTAAHDGHVVAHARAGDGARLGRLQRCDAGHSERPEGRQAAGTDSGTVHDVLRVTKVHAR